MKRVIRASLFLTYHTWNVWSSFEFDLFYFFIRFQSLLFNRQSSVSLYTFYTGFGLFLFIGWILNKKINQTIFFASIQCLACSLIRSDLYTNLMLKILNYFLGFINVFILGSLSFWLDFLSRYRFHILRIRKEQFTIATLFSFRKIIQPRSFIIGIANVICQKRIGNGAGILHSSFKIIKLIIRNFNRVILLGSRTHIIHIFRYTYWYFLQGFIFFWVYSLDLGLNTCACRSPAKEWL